MNNNSAPISAAMSGRHRGRSALCGGRRLDEKFSPSVHPRPDAERYMAGCSGGSDSSVVVSLAELPEIKLEAPAMGGEIGAIVNIR